MADAVVPSRATLIDLTRRVAREAGEWLLRQAGLEVRRAAFSSSQARELKAAADTLLEERLLPPLVATGLPVLSEESGHLAGAVASGDRFIVDPLDGTFNFVRGLGPSAVSVALWADDAPVFGAVYALASGELYSGGSGIGAWCENRALAVSQTALAEHAAICTGFPVRFDPSETTALQGWAAIVSSYAKVRMLGSAAMSLVNVATGAADAYAERQIMLWDVAAGLAIVEGAGGRVRCTPGATPFALDVAASNGRLPLPA